MMELHLALGLLAYVVVAMAVYVTMARRAMRVDGEGRPIDA